MSFMFYFLHIHFFIFTFFFHLFTYSIHAHTHPHLYSHSDLYIYTIQLPTHSLSSSHSDISWSSWLVLSVCGFHHLYLIHFFFHTDVKSISQYLCLSIPRSVFILFQQSVSRCRSYRLGLVVARTLVDFFVRAVYVFRWSDVPWACSPARSRVAMIGRRVAQNDGLPDCH